MQNNFIYNNKKFYFFVILLLLSKMSLAQQFAWIRDVSMPNYQSNYALPKTQTRALASGGIVVARGDSMTQVYSQEIFARTVIEVRDAAGTVQWQTKLGKKVKVDNLATDANGTIYISGSFMLNLKLTPTDSLVNTGTGSNVNAFLLCLNSNGSFRWARNISTTNSNAKTIEYLNCDTQGNAWYGLSSFINNSSNIIRLTATGADDLTRTIGGAATLGSFCFDSNNNLYVTGGGGQPNNLVFGGITVPMTKNYAMFILRINANGLGAWARVCNDITFQLPAVVAAPNGDVYWGGSFSDTISFGSIAVPKPSSTPSFFLTKLNSAGAFQWVKNSPIGTPILGKVELAGIYPLACDAASNVYLAGYLSGTMDWGNSVVSNVGAPYTFKRVVVTKIKPNGTAEWTLTGGSSANLPHSIAVTANNDCFFSATCNNGGSFGSFTSAGVNHNFVIGKISQPNVATETTIANEPFVAVFPNPSEAGKSLFIKVETDNLTLDVYNSMGQKLAKQSLQNGQNVINTANFPKGTYFFNFNNDKISFVKKIVIE